jgi:hypothetical protein
VTHAVAFDTDAVEKAGDMPEVGSRSRESGCLSRAYEYLCGELVGTQAFWRESFKKASEWRPNDLLKNPGDSSQNWNEVADLRMPNPICRQEPSGIAGVCRGKAHEVGLNPKASLVFSGQASMVVNMDKPWHRDLFARRQLPEQTTPQTSADAGDMDAQFQIGLQYASGVVGAPDYAQAAQWYFKAAEQNHALAQFNLGIMYAHGQGVAQNDAEAGSWFRKAAQQGDAGAQHNLGMSLYRASIRDASEDAMRARIESYKWFSLAAAQGYRGSESARQTVALKMTHEDVVEAARRVAGVGKEKPADPRAQSMNA